jgi:hypothetical protein
MSLLSHGQQIVLSHYLTEWSDLNTFDEIMQLIEDEGEGVTVWAPFEEWDLERLTDHMSSMANDIDKAIVDSHKEA